LEVDSRTFFEKNCLLQSRLSSEPVFWINLRSFSVHFRSILVT